MDDIKLINARLKELGQEFRDLSAMKDKLMEKNKLDTLKQTLSLYTHLAKGDSIELIDVEKLANLKDATVISGAYNLPVFVYTEIDGEQKGYGLAKSEEEALNRNLGNELSKIDGYLSKKKNITATEIVELYKEVLDGRKLEELTNK